MRILVCDDELKYCREINDYIVSTFDENSESVVEMFNSALDLVSFCMKYKPDVVFLDVELGKVNGIELARCLRQEFPELLLVYISAHPDYVFDSFETLPLNFLRKPFNKEEFDRTFKMIVKKYNETHKFLLIKLHKDYINLEIRDICYIESHSRHLIFRLFSGESYESVGKIDDVYKKLKAYDFVKSHQGYLVNMMYIKSFGKNEINMKNGESVLMSIRRKKQTKEIYSKYVFRRYHGG